MRHTVLIFMLALVGCGEGMQPLPEDASVPLVDSATPSQECEELCYDLSDNEDCLGRFDTQLCLQNCGVFYDPRTDTNEQGIMRACMLCDPYLSQYIDERCAP